MTNLQNVLYFDGQNDLVELTKWFPAIKDQVTVEFWSKVESESNAKTSIFGAYSTQRNRVLNVHLPWNDGVSRVFWDAGNQDGYDRIHQEIKTEEFSNIWVHWAFIKDARSGKMVIVVNGETWYQESNKHRSMEGIENFIIGSMIDTYHYWKGSLSDFRLWNIARNPEAIKKDMHHRLVGNESGLVAYLPLDEGVGNKVLDKTGNGNDGAIYGPTWKQDNLQLVAASKTCLLKNNGTDLILDIPGGQSNPGTAVWGYIFNNSNGQKWELQPNGVIKSKLGDFALDLQDIPGISYLKTVVVNPINYSLTQQWEITNSGVIKNKSNNYALVMANEGDYKIAVAYPINEFQSKSNELWVIIDV
ncbi:MAG: ricin-type beta-trefoil lectin domain protein [Crocosphaera sp.]|nr:ricin-type beta-trefoil lectin domain protein [Crocosphaera sp.]